jgi:ribosome-binding factor A
VCVSVYGTKEEQEETIRSLRHASGYIQHLVAVRLRMKFTPVLFFVTDPSIEHSDRISRILKELNISSDIDESTNGSNNSFDDGSEDPDITVSETDGEDVEE